MAWVEVANSILTETQYDNNAWECYTYFNGSCGWTRESVAAICANMRLESHINPKRRMPITAGAFGLTQWTNNKYKMQTWCNNNGYDYTTGDGQIHYIDYERQHPGASQTDQWYATSQYQRTFNDFAFNTYGDSLDDLTDMFAKCYERRAGSYPQTLSGYATHFYNLFGGTPPSPGPTPGGAIPYWLLCRKRKKWYFMGGRRYI